MPPVKADPFAGRLRSEDHGYATPCLVWTGAGTWNGYGTVCVRQRRWLVHRFAWTTQRGPIPDGMQIDHLCRVRRCVNVDHLEPVTQRENLLRGNTITARNAAVTHCPAGHEYSPENTLRPAKGGRYCRACNRDKCRRRRTKTPHPSSQGDQS